MYNCPTVIFIIACYYNRIADFYPKRCSENLSSYPNKHTTRLQSFVNYVYEIEN
jgi:hypothetical protein